MTTDVRRPTGGRPRPLAHAARRGLTTELFARLAEPHSVEDAQDLRERLVLANAQVALALARRFRGRGIELDDLEQTAYVALVRAVQQYDLSRGSDFMVYAVPSISGELKRQFRDHGWTIRVSRRIQETQRLLERDESATLVGERYDNGRLAELAARVGRPVEDVTAALAARGCFRPASLDMLVGTDGVGTLGDLLPSDDSGQAGAERRTLLESACAILSARDRRVLDMRYVDELTQREIGVELGVSQVQVSRLLVRIHRDMHRHLTAPRGITEPPWATGHRRRGRARPNPPEVAATSSSTEL